MASTVDVQLSGRTAAFVVIRTMVVSQIDVNSAELSIRYITSSSVHDEDAAVGPHSSLDLMHLVVKLLLQTVSAEH